MTEIESMQLHQVLLAMASLVLSAALVLFYFLYLKPIWDEKNYIKQKKKERRENEQLFKDDEAPIDPGEGDYKDFDLTEFGATSL